jgi:hypothetical protein
MNVLESTSWRAGVAARWTARLAGGLMFLFFLAFFFGEGPPDLSRLSSTEWLQAIGLFALFLGLPVAWKWEGLGGLMTVAGFGFMVAVRSTNLQRWSLFVPALVGAVHLASWGRLRTGAPPNLVPWRLPQPVLVTLVAVPAGFLLLCTNEIFGQPPLMTPTLRPGNDLAGDWHGTGPIAVDFVIGQNAVVTGAIGGGAITEGKITYGRTWFGRFMHFNTAYRITGKLSGERFSAPFDLFGDTIDGSLFLQQRPTRLILNRPQP